MVSADLTDAGEAMAAAEAVSERLGPIEVLVTCAGRRDDGLLMAQAPDRWAAVIQINLLGTYRACRAVVPGMLKRRGGRIVLVTSPVGLQGNAGQTPYAASKAGVVGLALSLARECAGRGVTVNAVAPGFIDSGITADLGPEAATGCCSASTWAASPRPRRLRRRSPSWSTTAT